MHLWNVFNGISMKKLMYY